MPAVVQRVTPDQQLVELWLNGMSRHTQRSYRFHVNRFFTFIGNKELSAVTLGELQEFVAHLEGLGLASASRHLAVAAVKSVFAFGLRLGYLQFDVARPLRMPASKNTLNERILEEEDVARIIAGETSPRNKLILQLLYIAGVRVSELVALTWADARAHRGGGQITVFGKGAKTRTIHLEGPMWTALLATRGAAPDTAPIFLSQRGGHLHSTQVLRIVKAATIRAGITKPVSPHWLRHCHASHALDRGAPIHLVQQTLGHSSVATTSKYLHARPNESSSRFLPPVT